MRRRLFRAGRGGFTLIELFATLVLLSVVAIFSTELFMSSFHLTQHAHIAAVTLNRVDSALARLRRDVWQARAMVTPTPTRLTLTLADGQTVEYDMAVPGVLRRRASGGTGAARGDMVWSGLPAGFALEVRGPLVLVGTADAPPLALVSQVQLAAGGRR